MRKFYISSLLYIIISITFLANAQQVTSSENEAIQNAFQNFEQKQYKEAATYFEDLLKIYPKDPEYHYYLGICYVQSYQTLDEAIKHLKYASTKEVPRDVYFHLGKAYHLSYDFDQALDYYKRFQLLIEKKNDLYTPVEIEIARVNNAKFLTRYILPVKLKNKKLVDSSEVIGQLKKDLSGKIILKPEELTTKYDKEQKTQIMMFMPNKVNTGEVVYFSAYGIRKDFGLDIFRVKKQNDGSWSRPENLGKVINTKFDEMLPIVDPDGSTLYFCSEGHYSMGGFDIYKSVFDFQTQTWSTPENLGFPINSPYNEKIYIPSLSGKTSQVFSNREGLENKIHIYNVENQDSPGVLTSANAEELKQIAVFEPVRKKKQEKEEVLEKIEIEKKEIKIQEQPEISKPAFPEEEMYNQLLEEALNYQLRADSVSRLIDEKRFAWTKAKNKTEKNKIRQEIENLEQSSIQFQSKADANYIKVREIEQRNINSASTKDNKKTKVKVQEVSCESVFGRDACQYYQKATPYLYTSLKQIQISNKHKTELEELHIMELETDNNKAKRKIRDEIYKNEKQLYSSNFKAFEAYHSYTENRIEFLTQNNEAIQSYFIGTKAMDEYQELLPKLNERWESVQASLNESTKGLPHKALNERNEKVFKTEKILVNKIEAFLHNKLGIQIPMEFDLTESYQKEEKEQPKKKSEVVIDEKIKPTNLNTLIDSSQTEVENKVFSLAEEYLNIGFKIEKTSSYNDKNPIPINMELPEGACYRIQLGAFSKVIPVAKFRGMYPITRERKKGKTITFYFAGMFSTYNEAKAALPKVRARGFKDAFLIAYVDGIRSSATKAKLIEKAQKKVKLEEKSKEDKTEESTKKELKLSFKVQLGIYSGNIPDDQKTKITKAFGETTFHINKLANGQNAYAIGDYANYEEASATKNKLKEIDFKGVFVVAYYGDNRIPLEQAKRLQKPE